MLLDDAWSVGLKNLPRTLRAGKGGNRPVALAGTVSSALLDRPL